MRERHKRRDAVRVRCSAFEGRRAWVVLHNFAAFDSRADRPVGADWIEGGRDV